MDLTLDYCIRLNVFDSGIYNEKNSVTLIAPRGSHCHAYLSEINKYTSFCTSPIGGALITRIHIFGKVNVSLWS